MILNLNLLPWSIVKIRREKKNEHENTVGWLMEKSWENAIDDVGLVRAVIEIISRALAIIQNPLNNGTLNWI